MKVILKIKIHWYLIPWIRVLWFRPQNLILCMHHEGYLNNSSYVNWKFPMMHIQHSVEIWLAVQHSVKSTASWLVDIGKYWEGNFEHKHALFRCDDICTTHVLQMWRRCGDDTISSGSQWPITYKNLLMISLVHASMMAFTNIDSLDITVKILNHIPVMEIASSFQFAVAHCSLWLFREIYSEYW